MSQVARLEQLRVDLGGQTILRELDFALEPGEVRGITGPNGSGKTTLVRVLATLVGASGGRGEVLGAELGTDAVYGVRRFIGLMGHNPLLLTHLSLEENLVHAARLVGIDPSRVPVALHTVGLEAASQRRAEAASFGMKRRLEVARLLMGRPRLLLLDEAGSGLDPAARALIDALVDRTTDAGGGVVVVSHDATQLTARCQSISQLSSGRLEPAS